MNESGRDSGKPPWKVLKYVAGSIALIGFLLFFSVFISGALNFGDFDDFEAKTRSMAIRGVLGMFLMISGIVLGGIAANQSKSSQNSLGPSNDGTWNSSRDEQLVGPIKIRCPGCRALNDEAAKFCDQCGGTL